MLLYAIFFAFSLNLVLSTIPPCRDPAFQCEELLKGMKEEADIVSSYINDVRNIDVAKTMTKTTLKVVLNMTNDDDEAQEAIVAVFDKFGGGIVAEHGIKKNIMHREAIAILKIYCNLPTGYAVENAFTELYHEALEDSYFEANTEERMQLVSRIADKHGIIPADPKLETTTELTLYLDEEQDYEDENPENYENGSGVQLVSALLAVSVCLLF